MAVYILKIPGSGFTGFMGGVDFYGGKGSTSSKADADRLIAKCGCLIVGPEPASEIKTEGTPEGVPPDNSTPTGETPHDTKAKRGAGGKGKKK